jgi:GT2 family glycosyltransferase
MKKMIPKVSLLVCTYNRLNYSSRYIPQLLEKAGQIDLEMLIWDNGSTDGSYDWASTFGQADCHVTKVFGHNTNIGMEAINYLAEAAKGQYLIKLDDDIDVPIGYAERLVSAYERAGEPRLLFLGWDMPWARKASSGGDTFATRSGLKLYKEPQGKTIVLNEKESVLIHYHPDNWMVNGACRLSPRDKFLAIGGHPKGIIYGVDKHISLRAAEHGYWIGYLHSPDLIYHRGTNDDPGYRAMKDAELHRVNSPRDV